jgi:hypothetical protein
MFRSIPFATTSPAACFPSPSGKAGSRGTARRTPSGSGRSAPCRRRGSRSPRSSGSSAANWGRPTPILPPRLPPSEGERVEELLELDEFAARSGVPASLIQAVEREGIRLGRPIDGRTRYTTGDIDLVRTALRLLEFGLPLGDLLGLARDADGAMRGLAERAVDLFDEHVRKPIRDTAGDGEGAAEQMVEAFQELLPAVTTLVSHHFRRVLLEVAEGRIEDTGCRYPRARRRRAPCARSSTRSADGTTS